MDLRIGRRLEAGHRSESYTYAFIMFKLLIFDNELNLIYSGFFFW